MKVLSWNCNCKFRDKYQLLKKYNADILIIQECEDPQQSSDSEYKLWAKNYLWVGDKKHQGLGVFAKTNITLKALPLHSNAYKLFLPVLINNQYTLVAVWTKSASTIKRGYINQLWNFLLENRGFLDFSKIIIAGDWNRMHSRIENVQKVIILMLFGFSRKRMFLVPITTFRK